MQRGWVHYSGSACMRPSLPGVMGRPSGDDGGGACRRSGQGEGGDRAAAGGGDGGQRWAVTWLGCVIAQARDGSQLTAVPQTFSSHNSVAITALHCSSPAIKSHREPAKWIALIVIFWVPARGDGESSNQGYLRADPWWLSVASWSLWSGEQYRRRRPRGLANEKSSTGLSGVRFMGEWAVARGGRGVAMSSGSGGDRRVRVWGLSGGGDRRPIEVLGRGVTVW
jgi:hypothetical protein